MAEEFKFTGDASDLLRAYDQLSGAEKNLLKVSQDAMRQQKAGYEEQIKVLRRARSEQEDLGRMAKRVWESTRTPLENYNRKLSDLDKLLKIGKISHDTHNRAIKDASKAYREAEQSGLAAFGAGAVKQLASFAAGFFSVSTAISAVTSALEGMRAEREKAGGQVAASEIGFAQLAQLALGDEGKLRNLIQKSNELFAAGGAPTLDKAAETVFALESAGAIGEVDFFKKMFPVFKDPAQFATSARALQTAVGMEDAGSFRDIASKALVATKGAPGTAEEVLLGTSRAAVSGKELGLSDEELMAAVATISSPIGGKESAAEAGTVLNALLRSLSRKGFEESGVPEDSPLRKMVEGEEFAGLDLMGMLDKVQGLGFSGSELQKFFGRQEAAKGFGLLMQPENRALFESLRGEIGAAPGEGVVGKTLAATEAFPELTAPRVRRQAAAGREVGMQQEGAANQLADALQDELIAQMKEQGKGEFKRYLAEKYFRLVRGTQGDEGFLQAFGERTGKNRAGDFYSKGQAANQAAGASEVEKTLIGIFEQLKTLNATVERKQITRVQN